MVPLRGDSLIMQNALSTPLRAQRVRGRCRKGNIETAAGCISGVMRSLTAQVNSRAAV